jgi:hypothetical protein
VKLSERYAHTFTLEVTKCFKSAQRDGLEKDSHKSIQV